MAACTAARFSPQVKAAALCRLWKVGAGEGICLRRGTAVQLRLGQVVALLRTLTYCRSSMHNISSSSYWLREKLMMDITLLYSS